MIEKRFINIDNQPDIETRSETIEDGKRVIAGYFSLANSDSVKITERINGNIVTYTERIDPAAFSDTDLSTVIYNVEHNNTRPIARTGANLTLQVTDKGLFARAIIPAEKDATTEQNDLIKYIDQRIIRSNSFAFSVAQDEWYKKDGELFRTIKGIKRVVDITSTVSPAYPDTFVFTRSLDDSLIINNNDDDKKTEVDVNSEADSNVESNAQTIDLDFQMNLLRNKVI